MDAINIRYSPMHKSANAKLQIKNFGTVNSDRNESSTIRTATLPTTVNETTVESINYQIVINFNKKKNKKYSIRYLSKQMPSANRLPLHPHTDLVHLE
jgi:hypothetical protein